MSLASSTRRRRNSSYSSCNGSANTADTSETSYTPGDSMSKHTETAGQYPVIPLRTEVQLPGHVGPLEIGREASVRAIEAATRDDNLIVIIPQKNPAVRDPGQKDLHEVGVRAEIVQVVKHSPGRFTCMLRFLERVHIDALVATDPFLVASVSKLASTSTAGSEQLVATTGKVRDYLVAV